MNSLSSIKIMKALLVLCLTISAVFAGPPDENGCTGEINLHPIIDTPPKLVKSVPHGQKYTIGTHYFI
jgi:hypothetical protein